MRSDDSSFRPHNTRVKPTALCAAAYAHDVRRLSDHGCQIQAQEIRHLDRVLARWEPEAERVRVVMTALLFMAAISWARDPSSSVAARVAGAVFTACVAILLSPIYPLLRFKSDERILEIGPSGIATTIGRRSGNIAWKDVARIESNANRVYIIEKTGNSFVVPCEAFADDVEQVRFTELATQWLNSAQAA